MPIMHRLLPCLAALLFLATGCRSHQDAARPAQPAVVPATTDSVSQFYTANFSCTAEGITATGQLRMQSDSVIWLSASKVIELVRARFTPDSAIIHAKAMGRCFRGNYNDLYRRFQIRTDYNQLEETLTSPNAETMLSDIARIMGIEATFTLQPWQKADRLNFPISIPENTKPL